MLPTLFRSPISALVFLLLNLCAFSAHANFDDRFQPYGTNYAIIQATDGDERAIEVGYSFKYIIYNCELWGKETAVEEFLSCPSNNKARFFFSYTGEFDFYMGTRDSGPVINRVSNPAFHLKFVDTDETNPIIDWIDFGIEHRSNGQVVDANLVDNTPGSPTFGQTLTQIQFNQGDHKYFDTISRGANYLSAAIGFDTEKYGDLSLSVKAYLTNDSNITWGPLAGTDTSIRDYDILNINYAYKQTTPWNSVPEITYTLEYVVGKEGFDTDSADIGIIFPLKFEGLNGWRIPWYLRMHIGPMDRLSDYTQERNSIGFGTAFSF